MKKYLLQLLKNFWQWLWEYGKKDLENAIKKYAEGDEMTEREKRAYNNNARYVINEAMKRTIARDKGKRVG